MNPLHRQLAAGMRATSVVVPGLISQWSFDEGAGPTIADSGPAGADLSLVGSPLFKSPLIGKGYSFRPIRDSAWAELDATTAQANYSFGTGDFALSVFIKRTENYSTWGSIVSRTPSAGFELATHGSGPNNFKMRANFGGASPALPPVPLNQIIHVVAQRHSGILTVYWDGVVRGTEAAPDAIDADTKLFVGERNGTPEYGFVGLIDDLRIYNRALSLSEIEAIRDGVA